ncbi:hypothetical protein ABZ172_01120 [Streptomyces sp. NPDC006296]|uniref:hypothetical protein n=1 Tax=Streptomyces sp. NPDC006296 TaxID=3156746 RepID=UPI0033AF529E
MEQRAAVKRYLQIAAVLAFLGAAFAIFLIALGNSGGWGILGTMARISMVGHFFIQRGKNGRT